MISFFFISFHEYQWNYCCLEFWNSLVGPLPGHRYTRSPTFVGVKRRDSWPVGSSVPALDDACPISILAVLDVRLLIAKSNSWTVKVRLVLLPLGRFLVSVPRLCPSDGSSPTDDGPPLLRSSPSFIPLETKRLNHCSLYVRMVILYVYISTAFYVPSTS